MSQQEQQAKLDFSSEDNSKFSDHDLAREAKGETGFNVDIEWNCTHQADNLSDLTIGCIAKALESNCKNCSVKDENWLCLKCGDVFCSRYRNAHMAAHNKDSKHMIAVSLADLSFWCYACNSYIESSNTKKIRFIVSGIKFGELTPKDSSNKASSSAAVPSRPKGSTSHATKEELEEHFDTPEKIAQDAKYCADLLKNCKHCVVYTGAGISTSTGIPDYRGPTGVWTLRDQGKSVQGINIEQAWPAYGHYALKHLMDKGHIHYVVSTNVDGLHRRSGVSANQMAELHGNCYRETCEKCATEYLRGYDVTKTAKNWKNHLTGRLCTVQGCGGALKDTIIHFSENLPEKELEESIKQSEKADVVLVLGTSMRVAPACKLPLMSVANGGKMIIVNLQTTPYDKKCARRVFGKTDEFLTLVLKNLGYDSVDQSHDALAYLKDVAQQQQQ